MQPRNCRKARPGGAVDGHGPEKHLGVGPVQGRPVPATGLLPIQDLKNRLTQEGLLILKPGGREKCLPWYKKHKAAKQWKILEACGGFEVPSLFILSLRESCYLYFLFNYRINKNPFWQKWQFKTF